MTRQLIRALVILASLLLLTGLVLAQETTPTPLPPFDLDGSSGIPQSISPEGYPQLGRAGAPVQIVAYCSFDAPACGSFYSQVFPDLAARMAGGDVRYTFVPLYGLGEIANGRAGARAALCAAEQGAFWRAVDLFYGWQIEFGSQALDGSRVVSGIESLSIDRGRWDACMSSDRPDVILDAARADVAAQIPYDGKVLPFVLINGVPSLPDSASLASAVDSILGQLAAGTPSAPVEATAEATPDELVVTVQPLLGQKIDPPLDITLPRGWKFGSDTLVLRDVDVDMRTIPLAVYSGPVTGGTGTIVLLWGFPSLVAGNPFSATPVQPDIWADGLRLLRLAVIEEGCNIGTDLRAQYSIGGLTAVGTQFSAVDCPQLADTRGWFAGVRISGINFVFYTFTDPIDAMNSAQPELQDILDTVSFRVPEPTAEPGP